MTQDQVDVSNVPDSQVRAAAAPSASASAWRNKTWQQAAGLHETAARLEHLPAGLAFPEDFPEPIVYDADWKLLLYRGFMYHGSYLFLRELSTDPAYIAALDVLYQESSCPRRSWRARLWLLAALIGLGAMGAAWWWLR